MTRTNYPLGIVSGIYAATDDGSGGQDLHDSDLTGVNNPEKDFIRILVVTVSVRACLGKVRPRLGCESGLAASNDNGAQLSRKVPARMQILPVP